MAYDKQLIVDGFRLDSERQRARFLRDKAAASVPPLPTETVLFPRAGLPGNLIRTNQLKFSFSQLTNQSRIYMIGHGNWQAQTLGGDTAQTWANTFIACGMPQVKLVSITGCQAGRDFGSTDQLRVTEDANSFASQFHQLLGAAGVRISVYARAYKVRIRSGGAEGTRGSKFTEGAHHRPNSKILFTWQGGSQVRRWVDYANKDDPDSWLDVSTWAEQSSFIASLMAL